MQIAVGALLGSLIDRAFDGTMHPLAYGFLACGVVALAWVLRADRSTAPAGRRSPPRHPRPPA